MESAEFAEVMRTQHQLIWPECNPIPTNENDFRLFFEELDREN